MSLICRVAVNDAKPFAVVAIQRTHNVGSEPDDVNGYSWQLMQDNGQRWDSEFPLLHRYGDGGVVLLAKVMQAWAVTA